MRMNDILKMLTYSLGCFWCFEQIWR